METIGQTVVLCAVDGKISYISFQNYSSNDNLLSYWLIASTDYQDYQAILCMQKHNILYQQKH